ncbi:uncharacterized protein LOC126407055 [Epinephelus moara]|uniref:uncharacterized protein LOC126407055 n=1 Tax=Epinephelus moara TaxID=300413 RepID=UPI00214EE9E0|nr:uncharacterized protein LOC126407055 [Epinephelus moara]
MWLFTSNRSANAKVIGRAKQCIQVLKDFQHLPFIVLVQDIIQVLSCVKRKILSSVIDRLQNQFKGAESHQVLQAAARLVDPREWPADSQELASYGRDHLATVSKHFANVLDHMGCDREKAQRVEWPSAKVLIKSLPQGLQRNAWQDFFLDDVRRSSFPNLLLIVELILVLPLSTASVERGFSAMKRTKTDWRSNLSVHTLTRLLFISREGPDMEHFNAMPVVRRWLKEAERRRVQ